MLPLAIIFFRKCECLAEQHIRKRTFWHVRPLKTQISLRIRAVWLVSSLSVWKNFASMAIKNAPSEDSDKIERMRRLI